MELILDSHASKLWYQSIRSPLHVVTLPEVALAWAHPMTCPALQVGIRPGGPQSEFCMKFWPRGCENLRSNLCENLVEKRVTNSLVAEGD
jgi:hypothetical protein